MTAPRWTLGVQDRPRLKEPAKGELVLGSKLKGRELSELVKGKGNGRMRLKKEDQAPSTALLDQLMARHSLENGKALDSSLDEKLLEALLKKKEAAFRGAKRRVELLSKDGPRSFDPNAPRGGAERGGGYLSALELLLREEREKEKKPAGGGKGGSAEKDERLDSKVLLKEVLKGSTYRDSYAELELRYESAVLEIEHLHEMLKVAKAGEQLPHPRWSVLNDFTCGHLSGYERKQQQLQAQYAAERERLARQQSFSNYPYNSYQRPRSFPRKWPSGQVGF